MIRTPRRDDPELARDGSMKSPAKTSLLPPRSPDGRRHRQMPLGATVARGKRKFDYEILA
jgi:hypothetical protein